MQSAMDGILFYTVGIGFLCGVAAGFLLPVVTVPLMLVMLVIIVGLLGVHWRGRIAAAPVSLALTLALFFLVLLCGLLRVAWYDYANTQSAFSVQVGEEVVLTGYIAREPDIRENAQHLYVAVDDEILLVTTDRYGEYTYGEVVMISGMIRQPESFTTDLGRTFNYPGYLKAKGVQHMISFAEVKKTGESRGVWLLATLLAGKAAFLGVLEAVIPEPQVGLAEGLLLGVKRALGEELTSVFRQTGIIHIVVLSGYNVALVVSFVMYILAYLVPVRGRVWFGVAAIISFAFLVGLSATVVRACIMAALILLAQATTRVYLITRALLFTAVLMVLVAPPILLYDPGFQLSFLATLGLIIGAPWLQARLGLVPEAIGIREFLTATLVTQFFVLPLLLYQIGELSIVAVVVNVLVLPMVPAAMLLTFVTGLVALVSHTLALPFAFLATLSLTYILKVATAFASLPFASIVIPPFPLWVMGLLYGLLIMLFWWLYNRPHSNQVSNTVVDLNGWQIVDESDITKGGEAIASPPNERPVFFR